MTDEKRDAVERYDSWKDTPHPMVETWAFEWAQAIYLGTDQTWIQRIELARLALRERSRVKSLEADNARLRDVARAAEAVLVQFMPEHIDCVSSTTVGTTLRNALDAARSSGARGSA